MTSSALEWVPAPGLVADLILLFHAGVVAFVVLGEGVFLLGGLLDWQWVRRFWLRIVHLILVLFVAVQSWLGQYCPLTLWEVRLRLMAGESGYEESFIEHWVGQFLFFALPGWVFVVGYSAFAVLVLFTWWWIPPRRGQ